MKKTSLAILLIFMITRIYGQDVSLNMSRKQVNNLYKSVSRNLPDTIRMDILLRLAQYHVLKPEAHKNDLDSAAALIRQAGKINARVKIKSYDGYYTLVLSCLVEEINEDKGKQLVTKAVKILEGTDDKYHLAMAYLELSQYYETPNNDSLTMSKMFPLEEKALSILYFAGNHEQKDYAAKEIISISKAQQNRGLLSLRIKLTEGLITFARRQKLTQVEIWSRKELADLHFQQGKTTIAEKELLSVLKEYESTNYAGICDSYSLLSVMYYSHAIYDKSLAYGLKAIKSVKSSSDSSNMQFYYYNMANIYSLTDDDEKRKEYLEKIIDYRIAKNEHQIYVPILQITEMSIKQRKPREALAYVSNWKRKYPPHENSQKKAMSLAFAECYENLKQNNLAEKYYKDVINIGEIQVAAKEIDFDAYADGSVAWFYLRSKQYGKARAYFNKIMKQWPAGSSSASFSSSFMYTLDSASGNYLAAINHMRLYQKLQDSIFNIVKYKQIKNLQIAYETEIKENEIRLLEQNKKVQQTNLQIVKNKQKWILSGIVMLTLLLGVNYNQYRLKKKSNQIITGKNALLLRLLNEKEWLLKEVHHRVKNNLHTVICLLESQAAYLKGDALEAIENSEHRIYAMSLIHQKLYQSDDIRTVDMSIYLPEFVGYLADSFGMHKQVRFQVDAAPLKLGVAQAIPISLIVNEAVTNAFKYAFPANKPGLINIKLSTKDEQIELMITDNGIGIDHETATIKSDSLGLKLMRGLSEDLNGVIAFLNSNGTVVKLVFHSEPFTQTSEAHIDENFLHHQ
jgi:two-component sensor histidine kinase